MNQRRPFQRDSTPSAPVGPVPAERTLSGIIDRVTYHNAENGFAVLRVKAKGRRDLATVVGRIAAVAPGEKLEASGVWQADPQRAFVRSIQLFDLIMPLTKGGPSDSTQTMVTFLYNYGVTRMEIGFGSAVGVVLFIICVVFAFGYKRVLMRHD